MGKPTNYKRRAESEWRDLPMPVRLGIIHTELQWATEDDDKEQMKILQLEADTLKVAIEKLTPRPAGPQNPTLPLGFHDMNR